MHPPQWVLFIIHVNNQLPVIYHTGICEAWITKRPLQWVSATKMTGGSNMPLLDLYTI